MLIKTTGLVLRHRLIGESDLIVIILTKDHGVIEASAKGAQKTRSPLTGGTQLYCYSEFCLYQGKNYYSVNSATTINSFYDLRLDVTKVALVAYLCDLTMYLSPTLEHSWGHLRFFLNLLHIMKSDKKSLRLLKAIFEFRVMSINGFMPNLVACDECAEHKEAIYYFLPAEGLIYCEDCFEKLDLRFEINFTITPPVLAAMRHIIYSDEKKVFAFNLKGQSLENLEIIAEKYTHLHTKTEFNILRIYKRFIKKYE